MLKLVHPYLPILVHCHFPFTKENEYIQRLISLLEEYLMSEAEISESLGSLYKYAQQLDKAEEYYRQALSLAPENPFYLNNLAFVLIDSETNIEEGLELVDQALDSIPDHYVILDTKGWGLYKQGKYTEALEILEKCWELKPIYNHLIYTHLEEVSNTLSKKQG